MDISKLNHDPKFKLESRRFSVRKCLKGKLDQTLINSCLNTNTITDTLSMARHQASMNQQNKFVHVLECPPDKDDNIPLPQLIQQLESNGTIKPLTNKKGKTVLPIIWRVDPDVPDYFLGDTMRLTQIILNLLSNAVKVCIFVLLNKVTNLIIVYKRRWYLCTCQEIFTYLPYSSIISTTTTTTAAEFSRRTKMYDIQRAV